MTEQNENESDPTATFRLDQEAAQNEFQTRENFNWESHVRGTSIQHDAAEQVARKMRAQAGAWEALAALLWSVWAGALLFAIVLTVGAVVRWFA